MNERKPFNIQDEADGVVASYTRRKWGDAMLEVFKEKNGVGCGCKNCAHRVVREANSWADFGTDDPFIRDHVSYRVDSNGVIRRGG